MFVCLLFIFTSVSGLQCNCASDLVSSCAMHSGGFGDFSGSFTSIFSALSLMIHFSTLTLVSGGQGYSVNDLDALCARYGMNNLNKGQIIN